MEQELTTRDVFQQLDTRLSRVEADLRALRSEMIAAIDQLRAESAQLRAELQAESVQLRAELQAELARLRSVLASISWRHTGLTLAAWLTIMGSIWLKD